MCVSKNKTATMYVKTKGCFFNILRGESTSIMFQDFQGKHRSRLSFLFDYDFRHERNRVKISRAGEEEEEEEVEVEEVEKTRADTKFLYCIVVKNAAAISIVQTDQEFRKDVWQERQCHDFDVHFFIQKTTPSSDFKDNVF